MKKVFEFFCPIRNEDYNCYYGYHGVLNKVGKEVIYCYKDAQFLSIIRLSMSGKLIAHNNYRITQCNIPDNWVSKGNLVFVNETTAIDVEKGIVVFDVICSKEQFDEQAMRLCRDNYLVDRFLIKNPAPSIYECYDYYTGRKMWRQKLKGYLYHEIIHVDNLFVFCTAEKGGGVFMVDELSGQIVGSIDTAGTTEIALINNSVYTYLLGEKGRIVKYSLPEKAISDFGELYKTTIDCPLLIQEDYALTVSFKKCLDDSGNRKDVPVIICFAL